MTKLNKYIKQDKSSESVLETTSVKLERRHMEFVRRLNLNLSRLMRDHLDVLIRDSGEINVDKPDTPKG